MKVRKNALLSTIVAGALWGTSFPAIKIGLAFADPFVLVFLRMLLATVLIVMISYATNNLSVTLAKERLVWYLGLLNGFAYLIQYVGMGYSAASKSSLLVNLSVVWVAVLSWLILKESFSKKKTMGIFSGLVGIFLITTNLNLHELTQGSIMGDGLVFLSGILWSFFILYNKRIVDTYSAFQFMPWLFLGTTLPLTLAIPLFSNFSSLVLSIEAVLSVVYTAIFCWLVPYYLWAKGLEQLSPASSTVILLTEVIVAIAVSFFFLEETFTIISWVGTFLVSLAIILASLSR